MSVDQLKVELLLMEVEDLFQRFRNLPHNARALILAKIRLKLLEDFKDFIIQENDINQETVIEISYENKNLDVARKEKNIIELPVELTEEIENICSSVSIINTENNFITSLEPTFPEKGEKFPFSYEPTDSIDLLSTESHVDEPSVESKTRFVCNYCGKQFVGNNVFKKHMKRHKNKRKYECAVCSLRFNMKEDLIKHLKIHSKEKSSKCSICSKQLATNTVLRNHMRVIHQKEEKYFCEKCNYFTYSNRTLKEHVKLKHDKKFKKYACLICNAVFNSKVLLKVHLRSHTGEKPFKCSLCSAAFVCSGHLTNHMNSVHGEKKFPCEVCEKSFKTAHKLKRHHFIHTKIKPFSCPFCNNYASNTQGNLTKHVKIVHQMNDFSYLKYKKMMLGELEEVKEEWIKNAESFTNEYLNKLANTENKLSIVELRKQYLQKKNKVTTGKNNQENKNEESFLDVDNNGINLLF